MIPDKRIFVGDVSADSYVASLINKATAYGASDIHIEPLQDKAFIRMRVDGVLREEESIPKEFMDNVVNHLKVLCNMEIGNVRLPIDGHFSATATHNNLPLNRNLTREDVHTNKSLDIRVSLFPTINGTASVLRLLNREDMFRSLSDIGFAPDLIEKVRQLTFSNYGMIMATGPTGAGKSTTIYSLLMEINHKEKNILTLEDPIEMSFDNLRQSQINPEIGFTFARGMKSILRQDPDVIMIGEIRDSETAEHAVQASLAGRAVYSTLHADTTIGGIARLIDMQIDRGLIAYAIRGIISQRLVRRVCPHCVTTDSPRQEYINFLNLQDANINYKRGAGCRNCGGSGYKGRVGVFEVLIFDDNFRAMIVDKASMSELQEYAEKAGMKTLHQDAVERVAAGVTTLEEVVRVV